MMSLTVQYPFSTQIMGNRLAAAKRTLNGQSVSVQGSSRGHDTGASVQPHGAYAGTATWSPPISDYGFYRIRVAMPGHRGLIHQREVTLVVIRPFNLETTSGEFGWILPEGDSLIPMEELIELMNKMGVSWLNFPSGTASSIRPVPIRSLGLPSGSNHSVSKWSACSTNRRMRFETCSGNRIDYRLLRYSRTRLSGNNI